jgi:hypothetical protein
VPGDPTPQKIVPICHRLCRPLISRKFLRRLSRSGLDGCGFGGARLGYIEAANGLVCRGCSRGTGRSPARCGHIAAAWSLRRVIVFLFVRKRPGVSARHVRHREKN